MIVDGKQIAEDIKKELKDQIGIFGSAPVLAVVVVGESPVIENFVKIKKRFAKDIGVHVEEHKFSDTIGTDNLLKKIEELSLDDSVKGIVVQLPLPEHIDKQAVFGAISANKDVDVISLEGVILFESRKLNILPPVTGAVREVLKRENVSVKGKKAVVVGKGRLVGKPTALWLEREGANVTVLTRKNTDTLSQIKEADILVLGAGNPGMIEPDMIREGVVLLDAGTSEDKGRIIGDANKVCADKCSVFTPVPGGIGPITVAVLFRNLFALFSNK